MTRQSALLATVAAGITASAVCLGAAFAKPEHSAQLVLGAGGIAIASTGLLAIAAKPTR